MKIARKPVLIIGLCFAMLWLLLRITSHFNGLYGQDAHEYYRYAGRLLDYFLHGNPPGDYFWPLLYPLVTVLPALVSSDIALSGQLVSFSATLICLWLLLQMLAQFYPEPADINHAIYALLIFGCSPLVLLYSMAVMSDALAMALTMALFRFAIMHHTSGRARDAIAAVLLGSAAVMTRYAVAPLVLLPLLFVLYRVARRRQWRILVPAALAGSLMMLPHLLIRRENSLAFLGHSGLTEWSLWHFFQRSFITENGLQVYPLPNLLYSVSMAFHPAYCFAGLLLLFFLRPTGRRFPGKGLLAGSLLLYAIFLAGIQSQNLRFLLPAFPLAALLLYPAWRRLSGHLPSRRWALIAGCVFVLLQGYFFARYTASPFAANRLERHIAARLRQYPPQNLYTFWIDGALRSYAIPQTPVNLWAQRLSSAETPALLLFNETQFAQQWQGQIVMQNYNLLIKQYPPDIAEIFSAGWVLYRLPEQREYRKESL